MTTPRFKPYDYAILRVVPRVERHEFINVGVVLHCQPARYLDVRYALDRVRLAALDPTCDADLVQQELELLVEVARGEGPMGDLVLNERFRWLAAPKSTVMQCSPTHQGLCVDPKAELDRLMRAMVLTQDAG